MSQHENCEQFERFTTNNDEGFQDTSKLIYHSEKFDEYGLIIHDGGRSYIVISYCPFCGKRLPESMRDQWFDELEELGFEDPMSDPDSIPEEYKSGRWMTKLRE